jgi:hypothetical protein
MDTRLRRIFATVVSLAWSLPLAGQAPPRTPIVKRGACPFECCQLGRWIATDTMSVFAEQHGRGRPAFVLAKGDTVRADSADFFTLSLGAVLVRRPLKLAEYLGGEVQEPPATRAESLALAELQRPLAAGDTIYIVGHEPEVGDVVWAKGSLATVYQFWDDDRRDRGGPALLVRPIVHEWWVHITHNGRRGWIQTWGRWFEGADACG